MQVPCAFMAAPIPKQGGAYDRQPTRQQTQTHKQIKLQECCTAEAECVHAAYSQSALGR